MQIFIDSANPEDVRKAYETGIVDGVTTNPSLAAKAGVPYKDAVKQILEFVTGPVSLEVLSTDSEGMIREGRELNKFAANVYVKLPMGVEAIKACKVLKSEGAKINMTLIFSSYQALLAAKAGADFVSPFLGREDDTGSRGIEVIEEIKTIYDNYKFSSQIIAASIRGPLHVEESALAGADIATIPPEIFWKLFNHPMTEAGIKQFLDDFKKAGIEPLV